MPTTICPECTEDVFVDAESEQGDIISCDECGSALVVVGLDPVQLDLRAEAELDGRDQMEDFDAYGYDDSY